MYILMYIKYKYLLVLATMLLLNQLSSLNNYITWSYYLTNHIRGDLPNSDSHARLVYLSMQRLFERTDLKDKHTDIYLKLNDVVDDCVDYIDNKGIYEYSNNYDKHSHNKKDIMKQIKENRKAIEIVDEKIFNDVAPLPFKLACSLNEKYNRWKRWLGIKYHPYTEENTYLDTFMTKTFPP